MKKELYIFLGIFLFLSIGVHFKEWTTHPIEHLVALPTAGAYGLGVLHPLIFTIIAYVILAIIRFFVRVIKRIATK